MIKIARNTVMHKQGKWTEKEVRDYLIDKLVSVNGKKIPIRRIFRDEEFMRNSGFYGLKPNGKMKPVSTGTISYWIEKLKITELDLYNHHKNITRRITCSFSEFTRKHNRNSNEDNVSHVILENYSTEVLIRIYNELCKRNNHKDILFETTPRHRVESSYQILKMFVYYDDLDLFSKEFLTIYKRLFVKRKKAR